MSKLNYARTCVYNDGLHIKTSNIEGNIGIGAIMIGGESIGSMQIQNLRMA